MSNQIQRGFSGVYDAAGHINEARLRLAPRTVAWSFPRRKLSDTDAIAIRQAYAAGDITLKDLAHQFEVSPSTVREIVQGSTYRDVLISEEVA